MSKWLSDVRENKDMSQEQVANQADIARTTYSSIEQGRRNPSVAVAKRIAKVLEIDWTIFFEEKRRETRN